MEHFLFAMQAVFPTACFLFLGRICKKAGVFTEEFLNQGNKLCFSLLFPILVFCNLYQGRGDDIGFKGYRSVIIFAYGMIFVSSGISMLLVPRVIKEKKRIPVFIQSIYRGNFMLYGLPFSEVLGGQECLMIATTMTAATLPILNVIAILQFSYYSGEVCCWKGIIRRIIGNPILWGVLLGLLFQKVNWHIPYILEISLSDLAQIATPLAFLILGGSFQFDLNGRFHKDLLSILFLKLLILPMVFLPFCLFIMKMEKMELIPVFIFLAAPTAVTTYQLAVQYDADTKLAGDAVIYSLLFSMVTIFILIVLLKTFGFI